jgi:hypothetical protein
MPVRRIATRTISPASQIRASVGLPGLTGPDVRPESLTDFLAGAILLFF